MVLFLQRVFDALANGAVYAALAVALSIVYRSSGMLNFALGELAMVSTFLALLLTSRPSPLVRWSPWFAEHLHTPWSVWVTIPVVMAVSMVVGAAVERVLVRRAERRSAMAVVSVTLGIGLLANGAIAQFFGSRFFAMKSPFPQGAHAFWRIGGARLGYETAGIVAVIFGALLVMWFVQRHTKIGLAFRAVASNRDSALLAGINVGRVLALGWGLAGGLGALAGIVVANNLLVSTSMMTRLFVFALASATIGGLDSPAGAALGGLVVALLQTLLGGYVPAVGGDLSIIVAIALLGAVLMVRPAGMFGRRVGARA